MASHTEKLVMILVFNECHQNSRQALQLYAERYPNRYQPAHNYFLRLQNQIRTYGSFGSKGNRRQIPQVLAEVNEETEMQVLRMFKLTHVHLYVMLQMKLELKRARYIQLKKNLTSSL